MTALHSRAPCVASVVLVALGCASPPTSIDDVDVRLATATILADFLDRHPPTHWPRIIVSDEYLSVSVDSQLLNAVPTAQVPVEVRRRDEVWDGFGTVVGGGLLLEPAQPRVAVDGVLRQSLNFWSTADFGGELLYHLKRAPAGGWSVAAMQVIWVF